MTEFTIDLELRQHDCAEAAAAAAAVRATARRLCAPTADLDRVMAILFGPTISPATLATAQSPRPTKTDRRNLTPEQRRAILRLLAVGMKQDVIAEQVGCSRSAVSSINASRRA